MFQILAITARELRTFFDSLIAYIIIVLFLGLTGFFTWIFGFNADVFMSGQVSMQPFFTFAYFTLLFFIPALTMRMFAEENKSGTIELLLTKPLADWQIILGKFLACLSLVGIALLFSLPYYIQIARLGDIDHGAVWCGYLALLLLSSAYISIGLFASSTQKDQIVAFLLTFVIGIIFLLIAWWITMNLSGSLGYVVDYLSAYSHYDSMSRGVIDSKSVVYFLSITALFLWYTDANLMKRNVVE